MSNRRLQCFTLANPVEESADLQLLLRRTAREIPRSIRRPSDVDHVSVWREMTADGSRWHISVYYSAPDDDPAD